MKGDRGEEIVRGNFAGDEVLEGTVVAIGPGEANFAIASLAIGSRGWGWGWGWSGCGLLGGGRGGWGRWGRRGIGRLGRGGVGTGFATLGRVCAFLVGDGLVMPEVSGEVGGCIDGESVSRGRAERAGNDGEGREGDEVEEFDSHLES